MPEFIVTRAHLKRACDQKNWDLLDKLLEIDPSHVNDNSLYTDGWGLWWGMLYSCVADRSIDGVRVLLKHGAQPDLASWGDGITETPLELARGAPEILALFDDPELPAYHRRTDPPLPVGESPEERAVNRQGEVRDERGLVFQPAVLAEPE